MWRWQSSQHRVGLQRAVIDQTQPGIKRASSGFVMLVPGSKRCHHQTGVGRFQRRTRSRVSRTCSAVNVGKGVSETATKPLPRFSSRICVGAISISRRPSLTRISSAWPGPKPRACRSGLGTTILPVASMVAIMAIILPFKWRFDNQSFVSTPCIGAGSGLVMRRIPSGAFFRPPRCAGR